MEGIDLNKAMLYENASLRFFDEGEHHVDRFCISDVLLLVYEGVLRFSEDGIEYEVRPGYYHIQKSHTLQKGNRPSDAPKYLYIHFQGCWANEGMILPRRGSYDYRALMPLMKKLDKLSHGKASYVEQLAIFYTIISALYQAPIKPTLANQIAAYLQEEYLHNPSLDQVAQHFHFSKNHILNVFKAEYHQTPIQYIHNLKLNRAEYLLEVTSNSLQNLSLESGFHNYSQFYRLFYRRNGMAPLDWRKSKWLATLGTRNNRY